MTHRDITIQAICAFLLALCVGASAVLSTNIASEAGRSQLVYSDRATEGDPPAVAYGIAMGAFRGLFVNYLWLRANRLKEEGKFHEAIQLSEAITTLQPRFPRVWTFQAWNMAYNISVSTNNAEERWEWVKAGIELLRDKALVYNPNSIVIYKELSWLYIHKIQGFMDDANRYYKKELAKEWTIVLGEPPELPDDTEEAKEVMADWLMTVVEAPNTLEQVIKNERDAYLQTLPENERATAQVPVTKVEQIVATIEAEEGLGLDFTLLNLLTYHNAIRASWLSENLIDTQVARMPNQPVVELMDDPEYAEAWEALIPHVRRRVLIDTYKLEPLRMVRYTQRYGPLDWRHPASHSLYWASKGVEETLQRQGTTEKSYVNTDRIVVHSLQELWRSGKIYYDFLQDSEYVAMYDLHYTEAYGDILENIIRPRATTVDSTDRAYSLYSEGYKNFILEIIRLYYRLGEKTTAFDWQKKLASSEWLNTNDPSLWDKLTELSVDQFVWTQLAEDRLEIPYVARTEITASIRDGLMRGLMVGDRAKWDAAYSYAERIHKMYKEKQVIETHAYSEQVRMEELPADTRDVAALVFLRVLRTGQIRPNEASVIYRGIPVAIRLRAYDDLERYFAQALPSKEAFDLFFPEPPGLEIYREQRRMQQLQEERNRANPDRRG